MLGAVHLDLVAIVVSEYDPAIDFFVGALGFELVEDSPALTTSGGAPSGGSWSGRRAPRRACCWRRPTGNTRPPPSGTRLPGGWASSSGWTTSAPRMRG